MDIPEELLTASENELYLAIGGILSQREFSALPPLARDLIEQGKQWANNTAASVQRRMCTNDKIRTLATKGFSTELVTAIAALLESLSLGTAATPLAVVLAKYRIHELCKDFWHSDSKE